MSVELNPPKRVRCQNPDESSGQLRAGVVYTADTSQTWDTGLEQYMLTELGRVWWDASRFVVVDDVIDCTYDEPTLPTRSLSTLNAEVFDFDRYNSLDALPGGRR